MKNRHLLNYPPYCYLALIILSATDYNYLGLESKKIKEYLKTNLVDDISILGPSLANPFRVNKIYRMNIIIKYKKENNIYEVLNNLINHYKITDKLRIDIDFNPRSF